MAVDDLQRRFHQLGAEREAILTKSAPARHVREAIAARVAALEQAMQPLTRAIKQVEEPLFEVDQERARLARALSGKTGVAPPREVEKPPMTEAEVVEVIKALKINDVVPVSVGGADPRIDQVMTVLGELAAKLEALPKSQSMDTVYSDLKNFAQAVQLHDETIAKLQADLAETRRDIGAFAANLEKGAG